MALLQGVKRFWVWMRKKKVRGRKREEEEEEWRKERHRKSIVPSAKPPERNEKSVKERPLWKEERK